MKLEKTFGLAFSTKFPDGSICSVTFGSTETMENILNDTDPTVLETVNRDLMKRVYKSTLKDIKRAKKTNNLISSIITRVTNAPKLDQAEADAIKILEDLD